MPPTLETVVSTSSNIESSAQTCPLSGAMGVPLRLRRPEELLSAYTHYSEMPIPPDIAAKYFLKPVTEYFCKECSLRWYSPARLGESDYYEHLSTFEKYYNPGSWDKRLTVQLLKEWKTRSAVDVGCGDGWVLNEAAASGVKIFGIDLNEAAVANARLLGRDVDTPAEAAHKQRRADVLVCLQTLEHVTNPVVWLREQIQQFDPSRLIIAVPAHDTMLGRSTDPLVWPPHHYTLWSGRALVKLSELIGFKTELIRYEPNSWERFTWTLDLERKQATPAKAPFPRGKIGRRLFKLLSRLQVPSIARAHTVLAVLTRE